MCHELRGAKIAEAQLLFIPVKGQETKVFLTVGISETCLRSQLKSAGVQTVLRFQAFFVFWYTAQRQKPLVFLMLPMLTDPLAV